MSAPTWPPVPELPTHHFEKFMFPVVVAALGIGLAARRFRARNHLALHCCSINIIHRLPNNRYSLKFRTVFEKPLVTILGNSYAASSVLNQARYAIHARSPWAPVRWWAKSHKHSDSFPFLYMKSPADQRSVMIAVTNHLSMQYPEGFLCDALDMSVIMDKFVVGLTCEDGAFLIKTRSMVVREDILKEIATLDETAWSVASVTLEKRHYTLRMETIRAMAIQYRKHPDRFAVVQLAVRK